METPGDARDSFFSSIFFAGFAYDVSVITILLREVEADDISQATSYACIR